MIFYSSPSHYNILGELSCLSRQAQLIFVHSWSNNYAVLLNVFFILAPSAPTNLSITLLSSTSISIEWSPPNNPNGQIRLYGVNCGRPLVSSFNSTMLYYECQWLEPGRQYKISVFAYTGAGEGEAVSVVVTTPCECE